MIQYFLVYEQLAPPTISDLYISATRKLNFLGEESIQSISERHFRARVSPANDRPVINKRPPSILAGNRVLQSAETDSEISSGLPQYFSGQESRRSNAFAPPSKPPGPN